MSVISIRLPNALLQRLSAQALSLHLSRTEYIRQAIELMVTKTSLEQQYEHLKQVSLRVRNESMRVNKEFSQVEHNPED